jgi:hypothetical protein
VGVAGWPDGRVKEASFGSVDVGLRLSELVRALVSELVSQAPFGAVVTRMTVCTGPGCSVRSTVVLQTHAVCERALCW